MGHPHRRTSGYAESTSILSGLADALDEIGFAPEHNATDEITLRHCPFLELSTPDGGLVCALHLGLCSVCPTAPARPSSSWIRLSDRTGAWPD